MIKQVIIIRKDLKMRRGKEIAQGAHASLGALLKLMSKKKRFGTFKRKLKYRKNDALFEWLEGIFTKICLTVNSEQELMDMYEKAINKKLNCCIIKDRGTTEFNNVPTYTCVAIGPDYSEKIDEITKDLKLY
jgi:PTH2 family peptidyl-tRNA hydrolase